MPARTPTPIRYFAVWQPIATRMEDNPACEDWITFEPRTAFHSAEVPAHFAREWPYLLEHGHVQEITQDEFNLIRANPPILTPQEGSDG